ncbi:MAG: class I SAM-dependent methyltransferase family protein [Candidatus Thermoplasmatota archaeon]|nr:class I SAM-dependent methyltransferase family protein [Candidatus Thermoplasmatota archaeon]MBS3790360.1 class I SAM-dependent methyltransferase family protein [Candidatus Thermoplasmatota archaeon]
MDCLKVPKCEGEKIRKELLKRELLDQDGKIDSEDDHLFLPLKKDVEFKLDEFDYEIVDREIEKRENKERDYKELVDVPVKMEKYLPSSYDIIGDIALVKIPEEIKEYRDQIGESILETHKNLKTVLEDKGVHDQFRTRTIEYIAGEKKTETIYKEHGVELEVDVESVYFSPRLATERYRIVEKTEKDEVVLDMFAGVGPYTVLIGKNVDVDHIYSIDLNPDAVDYLKKNVRRNNLEDLVTIYEGDAGEIAPRLTCDRIIMNLPHSSKNFVKAALSGLNKDGVLHYYEIIEEAEIENSLESLLDIIDKLGYKAELLEKRLVRTYSSTKVHMAYDILVEKK